MDELISDFLEETNESLVNLDNEIVRLEQNPNDQELLGSIFRIMHTIKGTCGFLGLGRLEKLAHAAENVLGKIREGEIQATEARISIVLKAIDRIKEIIEYLETNGSEEEGGDGDLIKELDAQLEDVASQTEVATNEVETSEEITINETKENAEDEIVEKGLQIVEKIEEEKPLEKPNEPKKQEKTNGSSAQQTIRVSVNILEELMQTVSELVLNRNQLMQILRKYSDSEFQAPIQHLNNITSELQEQVMQTRMQPISGAWSKFPRLVRDLSQDLGKKIQLNMIGEETELDRQLIEAIKDPLTHMVRNSCDHGLEGPEERLESGKSEIGTVTLNAYHQGGHIIIEISDDGRGISIDKVKEKILKNGLANADEIASMSNKQIMQYIFAAGFSTAEQVTSVSGRGVGMDVVRSNIEKISGNVELNSVPGKGSTFLIKIPLTLAIMPILIVSAGNQKFGIPQINVLEIVQASENSDSEIEEINGNKVLRLREKLLPLISLSQIMEVKKEEFEDAHIVIVEIAGKDFGLVVHEIYDTEEIVVKPVSSILKSITIYSGSTLLGDGSVIMILDPNGIANMVGDIVNNGKADNANLNKIENSEMASFLVAKTYEEEAQKAVPLEIVSRLEEVSVKNIEISNGKPVAQYRGGLIYLTSLSGHEKVIEICKKIDKAEKLHVIVFYEKNNVMGLVVEKILDIIELKANIIPISNPNSLYNGSIVINEITTDLIDVSKQFDKIFELGNLKPQIENQNSSHKIMFVDDSAFFRKFIAQMINEMGLDVVVKPNAIEALELLETKKDFDLIITDINMPKMSGVEFAAKCKEDENLNKIPIIALSSYVDAAKGEEMVKGEFVDYVTKTNNSELKQSIKNILANKSALTGEKT